MQTVAAECVQPILWLEALSFSESSASENVFWLP